VRAPAHDAPLAALRALWTEYAPQGNAYLRRAIDPESMGP
ncbi:MAG: DUF1028 domain-containing protein, partial [Rubritepida sp.]|nr:DUF1028 domain-containing protein [Rubritepida sp.]